MWRRAPSTARAVLARCAVAAKSSMTPFVVPVVTFCAAATATVAAAAPAPSAAPAPVPSVVLYQYESCPFCNKVRAQLDYNRIPYVVVEVDPLLKAELAWSARAKQPYAKVPVAVINGERVCDSSHIMDALDELAPRRSHSRDAHETRWREYVDTRVIHLLSPNLYRSIPDALASFDYLTQRNFSPLTAVPAKYVGAVAMYFVGKKLKATHMKGEGDERAHLVRALDMYADEAVGATRDFCGGASPNAADVSLFGILRAIRTLDTFKDVMAASRIAPWYRRMEDAVGASMLQHRISEAPSSLQR